MNLLPESKKRKLENAEDFSDLPTKKRRITLNSIDLKEKKCCTCKEVKSTENFTVKKCHTSGEPRWHSQCIPCKKEANAKNHQKQVEFLVSLIRSQKYCGVCKIETMKMDFGHYKKNKSGRSFSTMSIKRMKKELHLGRFLCFMCHYKETRADQMSNLSDEFEATNSRKKRAIRYKHVNKRKLKEFKNCKDCNLLVVSELIGFFEFDHLDFETKVDGISVMISKCRPISEIDKEIDKCELVCRNCHYDRTDLLNLKKGKTLFKRPTVQRMMEAEFKKDELKAVTLDRVLTAVPDSTAEQVLAALTAMSAQGRHFNNVDEVIVVLPQFLSGRVDDVTLAVFDVKKDDLQEIESKKGDLQN